MKKLLAITITAALTLSLVACSSNEPEDTNDPGMTSNNYRVGVASYTTTDGSYGYAEDKNGQGSVSTTYVTCVVDEDDNIQRVYIDEVETKINFDKTGQLADYTNSEVLSKRDLGDDYGMKSASGIGKEWHEQIDALEEYMSGKDINTFIGGIGENSRMMGDYNNYNQYGESYNQYGEDYGTGIIGNGRIMDSPEGTMNGLPENGGNSVGDTVEGAIDDIGDGVGDVVDDIGDGMDEGTDENIGDSGFNNEWQSDLTASVTIDTDNIMRAVRKAYENAR